MRSLQHFKEPRATFRSRNESDGNKRKQRRVKSVRTGTLGTKMKKRTTTSRWPRKDPCAFVFRSRLHLFLLTVLSILAHPYYKNVERLQGHAVHPSSEKHSRTDARVEFATLIKYFAEQGIPISQSHLKMPPNMPLSCLLGKRSRSYYPSKMCLTNTCLDMQKVYVLF